MFGGSATSTSYAARTASSSSRRRAGRYRPASRWRALVRVRRARASRLV